MSYDTARRKYLDEGRLTKGVELGLKLVDALDFLMKALDFGLKYLTFILKYLTFEIFSLESSRSSHLVGKSSRIVW